MPFVQVKDIKIYYKVKGNGYPFVLIRGLSSSLDSWPQYTTEQFSKNFKTILFDNRGAGRTSIPEGKYSSQLMARDTIGLMDALGVDQAYILGYSMGGCIAQEVALNYPDRVSKLILASSWSGPSHGIVTPNPEENPFPRMLPLIKNGQFREMAQILTNALFSDNYKKKNPQIIEKVIENYMAHPPSARGFEGQIAYVETFDTFERLSEISVSTLILHGAEDKILPVENARILAENLPSAGIHIFEHAGHGVIVQEQEAWMQKVIEFLKKK